MSQQERFIGIDVSKTTLDVAVRPDGTTTQFTNTADGIAACVASLAPLVPTVIVIEATGGYERPITAALIAARLPVAVVNPRQAHDFAKATGQLAKTDRLDAHGLAWFGEAIRPQPRPLKSETAQQLDALVLRYQHLITMRTMERNRLPTAHVTVRVPIQAHIAWLSAQLEALDDQMQSLLDPQTAWQAQATILRSVPGVGPGLTRTFLARLPEFGTLTRRRIAALVGVAPFNRDSGTLRGKRAIWGGRPEVRTALYMSALAGLRWNPVINTYYHRVRAVGKPGKVALTACMRKLLTILNALIRTQTPWDADFCKKMQATS